MNPEMVISLAEKGVYMILILSGPIMLIGLIVGLVVSIFQAMTQIQEQTLAFIPKIVAMLVGLVFFGPWMLTHMISYTSQILSNLTQFVG
ncbi:MULTISPECIES: flagellar biosynthesis protein FliQ [Bacillus]|jgi:flagellar biosynthetic protein FliQ|uniref:Flagellar biosynthetic protein FliQ n=1 Tax=Bacillus smithii 7_3_47FAA TaxID=665952 RepID=G9QMS7_9BACI|nr:flagellar biosynthesis protein FliQ [Bacillus smithii]AKP46878.1 Flagellar biosynthesis protein FliQ [Bacillus smithii]EHL76898.1 flagellar biosynthetic protein FliQ [Bacillus smithii 7_3_47FAA]MED0660585.1 flagellar biosynthesis protein FliQ [Bacillus smithii]MED1419302.1 flagellar biosynthesis protein FliQ [Bacillus smithii]MED1454955.1 flagellar biosynthesis protein FliQ [Bacillus smithii]